MKLSVKDFFSECNQIRSFFNSGACNFIKKETLAQVFSCEFFEISKNTFFYRTPLVATSRLYKQQISHLLPLRLISIKDAFISFGNVKLVYSEAII